MATPFMVAAMTEIRTRTVEAGGLDFVVDEAGEGDAVALFLHGFPEGRASWRSQLPALARLGWRSVAPDLRGYGQTSRPLGREAYRMDRLIGDVEALFEALGARRRLLIGHDWGGIIAWAYAIERSAKLDGLIIVNAPHPGAYLDLVRRSPTQLARSWYALFFQLPWLPEAATTALGALAVRRAFESAGSSGFPRDLADHYAEAACAPGAMTAMINYYRANLTALGGYAGRAKVAAPTLIVWGEQDPYLSVGLAQASADLCRDAKVEQLAGADHWAHVASPDAVNGQIEAWMRERGLAERQQKGGPEVAFGAA
jgi:pimeloyl-ACP methyl ester carboxylesterase